MAEGWSSNLKCPHCKCEGCLKVGARGRDGRSRAYCVRCGKKFTGKQLRRTNRGARIPGEEDDEDEATFRDLMSGLRRRGR